MSRPVGPALAEHAAMLKRYGFDRPKHDPRTTAEFTADLQAETRASLRRDPTRWPWIHSGTIPRQPAR